MGVDSEGGKVVRHLDHDRGDTTTLVPGSGRGLGLDCIVSVTNTVTYPKDFTHMSRNS